MMLNRFKAIYRIVILSLGLVFLLGITPTWAAQPLPEPNAQGNYVSLSSHLYWQVVDSDPNGLNCRMGNSSIEEIWNPDNPGFPSISNWPVVATFKPDEIFRAQVSYSGFVFTRDAQFLPWIFVKKKLDGTPTNCFIRANSALIKPVEEPMNNNISTPPVEQPKDNISTPPVEQPKDNISTPPVEQPTDNNIISTPTVENPTDNNIISTPTVETLPDTSSDNTEPFIDL
ncbi:hypothetical protein [Planktothrix agardhii]|jgi:hypothetical protein|uniref:hypothetical protein n=1 Tax=Planktothrix agardhii TaxID=1160 RepID=UPI001D0A6C63|nr:hypothetical protein [Planktothrix agardhii]MCB8785947.1 hypothetical protein [Planktothrix agardhii 1025]MCF3612305.1 hypothetical protein [Planktothrix agardhii 1027]MCF3646181.1 hypothetical protein [Planktothrix agardhii 1026]